MSRTDSPAYLAQLLRDYIATAAANPAALLQVLPALADRIEQLPPAKPSPHTP